MPIDVLVDDTAFVVGLFGGALIEWAVFGLVIAGVLAVLVRVATALFQLVER
jgi:heme/copper-type cytochrome/quinol oxidase subunit 1